MQFVDRLTLDAPRRTRDGFMAVRAKAARVGVYDYLGSEIDPENRHGLRDKGMVKVLRDEATVFDKAAAQSFIGKPVTDDHPTQAVTADNWRQHARGTVMGAIRDGDYLAFDLLLTDASAIAKVDAGKRELSNGYAASLEFGDFAAPDGTKCVARQTSIQGNHVALVDRGRAGPECRISDAFALCDAIPTTIMEPVMKTIMLDGIPVNLGDAAAVEAAISKLQDNAAKAAAALTDAQAALSTETGKVAALEKQLADAKAELEPAAIAKRVADRAKLVADAKKLAPTITTDAMSEGEIRRAIVSAKLGDVAKDLDDAGVAGAFITLMAGIEDAAPVVHNLAPAQIKDSAAVVSSIRQARYA